RGERYDASDLILYLEGSHGRPGPVDLALLHDPARPAHQPAAEEAPAAGYRGHCPVCRAGRGRGLAPGRGLRPAAARLVTDLPVASARHPFAQHLRARLRRPDPGRPAELPVALAARLYAGAGAGPRRHRWQDPAALRQPGPGAGAVAPGERLG